MNPEIKIKKLAHFVGELPKYQTSGASGFDVGAALDKTLVIKPMARELVPTGMIIEIPVGYEIQVRPRSGLAIKKGVGVLNSPGTIDCDYRGEVKVIVINLGEEDLLIAPGDRIAQMVVQPVIQARLIEADAVSVTERGAGGFGSTGVDQRP